ncbi:MAG: amidase [Acetobacteraceae bacterium]|nr:amidase [Acetobacteraceae bacterium]
MDDDIIAFTPAIELASLMREKRISPVEVMRATLDRIERFNPRINAFAHLASEAAMVEARAAEAALIKGRPLGRLHGLPVTIKDLAITKDMPTQFGSNIFKGNQPAEDSVFVRRLRAAGAIVTGKTTTSEFGWTGVSHSPLTGITHNPWQHGMNAGASSAGAGAAAAAGFGALHQGSDGAGSVRMPSHFCGVFGLKPTYGRIPYYPVGGGDNTSHIGPMTRSVADSALMMEVMVGPSALDYSTLESWGADYTGRLMEGVKGKRIAFSPDLDLARVDPDVAELVKRAAHRFSELGAHVEQVATPWAKEGPELIRATWPAHLSRLIPRLAEWESRMDPGLVACIRAGEGVTMTDYQLVRERKYAYCSRQLAWLEEYDFLLTPAASVAAFPAERLMPHHWPEHEWDWVSWAEFSYPFNFSGAPAASVPCGFTPEGLPVGLQIVGKRFDDLGVLQAAAAYEAIAPWAAKRPPLS